MVGQSTECQAALRAADYPLYNLLQVVRGYLAVAQAWPIPTISLELVFDDVHRQLIAVSELVVARLFEPLPDRGILRQRVTSLLAAVWTFRWLKAPPQQRKPRPRPTHSAGKHTSVQRLLEAHRQELSPTPRP